MNRIRLIALFVAVLAFFASKPAQADQAKLLACVEQCTKQMNICLTGQEPNLSIVCNGVAECNGLDKNDLSVFHDVCALCINGASKNCPSAAPPATDKAPPSEVDQPVPPPDTFETRCKSLNGWPVPDVDPVTQKPIRICLTPLGVHNRLKALEARMMQYKDNGQPVPPPLKDQIQKEAGSAQSVLEKLRQMGVQNAEFEELIKRLLSDALGGIAKDISQIKQRSALQDERIKHVQDAVTSIPRFTRPSPSSSPTLTNASVRHALMGLYIGPYYGRNLYDHYGVALHAVGIEGALLPSLSQTGAWRLELNFGAGYGGFNTAQANGFSVGERLWESHVHLGPRYTWESGVALTGGLGMNRRSTFSHDDVAATWIGAFIQPSYSLANKDGHGFYILGRLGVGNTHFQHAIIDSTGNKRDYEFNVGLGYAFLP